MYVVGQRCHGIIMFVGNVQSFVECLAVLDFSVCFCFCLAFVSIFMPYILECW